jgi:hypothetical protein
MHKCIIAKLDDLVRRDQQGNLLTKLNTQKGVGIRNRIVANHPFPEKTYH